MRSTNLPPLLARIERDAIDAGGREGSRFWYGTALKISEATTDPEARWAILLGALRQIGWPKNGEHDG